MKDPLVYTFMLLSAGGKPIIYVLGKTSSNDKCLLHTDIDECDDLTACEQNCINNDGSYVCTCNTGYVLTTDLHGCLG